MMTMVHTNRSRSRVLPGLVWNAIADALDGVGAVPSALGHITLHPHQRAAVSRIRAILGAHRIALLADDVGLGKTYVAAAIAAQYRTPLIVAPSVLRATWEQSLQRAQVAARVISMEQLSRDVSPSDADLLILDEAHHFRTTNTKRWTSAARIAADTDVLLLSATPIHNHPRDLAAIFALALGGRARADRASELAPLVVRRTDDVVAVERPHVGRWERVLVPMPDAIHQAIATLPPPLPVADGRATPPLVRWSLWHAWSSSVAALRATVRRRMLLADALDDALTAGRHPTRAELRAWRGDADSLQLAFPELMAAPLPADGDRDVFRATIAKHRAGLATLRDAISASGSDDTPRADILRRLLAENGDQSAAPIIAFTQYAATVRALGSALRGVPGVALLTSARAEIASGVVTREDLLSQFASDAPTPAAHQRIRLLIATDLLSEGVNLPKAGTVVHLDTPWTAARLSQRTGRAVRIGSTHREVRVISVVPEGPVADVLAIADRLQRKANDSARLVGRLGLLDGLGDDAPASAAESVARLAAWARARSEHPTEPPPTGVLADSGAPWISVHGPALGWIAVLRRGSAAELVCARQDRGISRSAAAALVFARELNETGPEVSGARLDRIERAIAEWGAGEAVHDDARASSGSDRLARHLIQMVRSAVQHARPHHRPLLSARSAEIERQLRRPLSAGQAIKLTPLIGRAPTIGADALLLAIERQFARAGDQPHQQAASDGGDAPASPDAPHIHALIVVTPVMPSPPTR
jgi:superfamily II DNA or RNA helicase